MIVFMIFFYIEVVKKEESSPAYGINLRNIIILRIMQSYVTEIGKYLG